MQRYETLNKRELPANNIDRSLNCIRLGWKENPGEPHSFRAGKKFVLIPLKRIRSAVKVLPKDEFLDIIDAKNCRKPMLKSNLVVNMAGRRKSSMLGFRECRCDDFKFSSE